MHILEKPTKEEDKKVKDYITKLTKNREPWMLGTGEWMKIVADLMK